MHMGGKILMALKGGYHRVVRSDGSVGGKTQLLSSEGVKVRDGFIVDMNDTVYRF